MQDRPVQVAVGFRVRRKGEVFPRPGFAADCGLSTARTMKRSTPVEMTGFVANSKGV